MPIDNKTKLPGPIRQTELPPHNDIPLELESVYRRMDERLAKGESRWFRPIPTGFSVLDAKLGGGLFGEDLFLVGGPQGTGKTALALQAASQIAKFGKTVLYICYEHSPLVLAERILCQVSAEYGEGIAIDELHNAFESVVSATEGNPSARAGMLDLVIQALGARGTRLFAHVDPFWHRLLLVRGDGLYTHIDAIEKYIDVVNAHFPDLGCVVIDYAQRVPVPPRGGAFLDHAHRIDEVMRGLKSFAVKQHIPVVAVAAADEEGLRRGHVHLENLWGPVTVQYEPDGAILLNKVQEGLVRLSLEKNRHGPSDLEWDVNFAGAYYRFDHGMREIPAEKSWQVERGRMPGQPVAAKAPA